MRNVILGSDFIVYLGLLVAEFDSYAFFRFGFASTRTLHIECIHEVCIAVSFFSFFYCCLCRIVLGSVRIQYFFTQNFHFKYFARIFHSLWLYLTSSFDFQSIHFSLEYPFFGDPFLFVSHFLLPLGPTKKKHERK